ncbi:MAG TPA: hypothetical protein VG796_03565 [Verrucomicrobiales bacterium]|nr:hypothetical protein [Verrucomicrobiales bacterium]
MFSRLLLTLAFWCAVASPLRAQAPGTAERRDIDGDYRRPDLKAPLFDARALSLPPEQVDAAVHELQLIARNFQDSPVINHRLRAHALAVALRLEPDDRSSVVANGQLARGVTPSPLSTDAGVTEEVVAQRLFAIAFPLLNAPEKPARDLSLLLLDITCQLDRRLQPRVFAFTYGASPNWYDSRSGQPALDAPPTFQFTEAEVQLLLPGLDQGRLRTVTVKAVARPSTKPSGLKLGIPEPLRREMADPKNEALKLDAEKRMEALRATLRLRHEVWPEKWSVDVFIPDPHAKALPQLFAGMAVTIDSLLGGETLDPNCLIAAGADPAGKLQTVMPVEELLPAAALMAKPPVIILPPDAGDQIDDWLLLHPDQWPLLFRLTMHRATTVGDAMALLKTERAPMLEKSLTLFAEVAARLRAAGDPLEELRRPETVAQLKSITSWHPQHLSAAALLSVVGGGAPSLSPKGSLTQIDKLALCVLSTDRNQYPLHTPRPRFEKSDFGKSADALRGAMKMLHPSVRPYAEQVISLATELDRSVGQWSAYLKKGGAPDPPQVSKQRGRTAALRAELKALNP